MSFFNKTSWRTYALLPVFFFFYHLSAQTDTAIRIACVGNSITYGHGITYRTTDAYPAQLQTMLNNTYADSCIVVNFGNSGKTMLKKGDYPFWKTNEFKNALAFKPHIVIILLGTNDSKPQNWNNYGSQFYNDYKAMVDTFVNRNPSVQIFACYPPKAFDSSWDINDSVIVNGVIPEIRKIVENTDAKLIDFYEPLKDSVKYFPDNIHPNKGGLGIMAAIIKDVFEQNNTIASVDKSVSYIKRILINRTKVHYKDTLKFEWGAINTDSVYLNGKKVDNEGIWFVVARENTAIELIAYGENYNDTVVVPIEYYFPEITNFEVQISDRIIDAGGNATLSLVFYDQENRIFDTVPQVRWSAVGPQNAGEFVNTKNNTVNFTSTVPGDYSVNVTYGSIVKNAKLTVTALNSTDSAIRNYEITNPFSDEIIITSSEKISYVRVVDSSGKEIVKRKCFASQLKLDTFNMLPGAYIYSVQIGDALYSGNIIKE